MANEITPTEAAALVPEEWGPRFVKRFYAKQSFLPSCLNITGDFKGVGDIAHIAVEAFSYTVNDTGSDGSLTVQTQTLTDVSLTVNKNKEVTVEFTQITRDQAFSLWEDSFPGQAGDAVRAQMEGDGLALVRADVTQAAGDGTGNIGEDELLSAIQTLLGQNIPVLDAPGDCAIAIADTQFGSLKKQNLLDYNRTGDPGKGGAATAKLPSLWEIPVSLTTKVESNGGKRYNVLFHKTAFAWAAQRNVTPKMADRLAAAKLGYIMNVSALYGVKTVVAARAVQLLSKA